MEVQSATPTGPWQDQLDSMETPPLPWHKHSILTTDQMFAEMLSCVPRFFKLCQIVEVC